MKNAKIKVFGHSVEFPESSSTSDASVWTLHPRPGGWVIAENEKGRRKRMFYHENRSKISCSSSGRIWSAEWSKGTHSADGRGSVQADDSALIAHFPGKVRKILVEVGASVQIDDPLILLEAMKMEFQVRAPYAGKVVRLLVKEGQQLSPGDRLADIG